ncbi:o-succinylbenzoate--CoA ligase [Halosimplex carlsbadense 2-9-1]|uniref:O-succinylbenzoate--CoA ligase n=1 Tax=Halosimplex carlsbadense 2-9-1 TaxID=797114 RepID=M0CR28_9EURY|nr:AMP-binding protein [Halosimplex carlsbadense]ELZ24339.1 o-succinylbenzoate--CoA ligase [Halosimplex carlsbadense 2-9-1]
MTLPNPAEWPVDDPVADPSRDLLAQRAAASPAATAVVDADDGGEWTYAHLDDRASARAAAAEAVADTDLDGARVGLLLGTRPAVADLYFALGRLGAGAVALNVDLPTERLRSQAERADIDLLVCEGATEDRASAVAPPGTPVASVDDPAADEVAPLAPGDPAAVPPSARPLDAERVVMFTSGTSGEPKGVRLTRRNLIASAVGSANRLGVEPGDRWLVCLPTYHMGGLAPIVRSTLYGTTTVVQREFAAEATARVLAEFDITAVSLVPTMLTRLLDAGWTPADSLRFVLLGGAPATRELVERCAERGVPACPTYGMTETASQIATATPAEAREYTDTVGRPLEPTTVTLVADDGTPLDAGESGELVVSGPTVAPGYLDGDQTAAAFDDLGFHTGDLGYADGDGRLWVVGRVDDAIVTGGENVHPARVADALRAVEGVADAAVVGLPDEEWGERVAALVVPDESESETASLTSERVRDAVGDRLAAFAVPKTVGFTDEIPRTHSGTVDRETVCERLAAVRDGA